MQAAACIASINPQSIAVRDVHIVSVYCNMKLEPPYIFYDLSMKIILLSNEMGRHISTENYSSESQVLRTAYHRKLGVRVRVRGCSQLHRAKRQQHSLDYPSDLQQQQSL
jgi:hypothetical protein